MAQFSPPHWEYSQNGDDRGPMTDLIRHRPTDLIDFISTNYVMNVLSIYSEEQPPTMAQFTEFRNVYTTFLWSLLPDQLA